MGWLTQLPAAMLYSAVIRPIRVGKRLMPGRIWGPIGAASVRVGWLGGHLAKPFLTRDQSPRGRLAALLRFTELAEEPLGIRGTNEIVDERTARRTIQQCPFAERLRDVTEFCTCVGACAARGAFTVLTPGAEFTVVRTKSQGAA